MGEGRMGEGRMGWMDGDLTGAIVPVNPTRHMSGWTLSMR